MSKIQRALISVSDKTGIVEFAKGLHAHGVDLLSTGLNYEQPAANIAEYYGIPLVSLHHFPMRPNSEVVPTLPSPVVRSTGSFLEWLFWRATKDVENEQRAELGLPTATTPSPHRMAERGALEIQAYDDMIIGFYQGEVDF